MKTIISVLVIFWVSSSYAQSTKEKDAAISFLQDNHIKLNSVVPPNGFIVYYNCDSLLFLKGVFGDTIKIWTPLTVLAEDIESAKKSITNKAFGHTQLITGVQNNGTMLIARYHQTQFIYRHDSLYQLKDSVTRPVTGLIALMTSFLKKEISDTLFKKGADSVNAIPRAQAIYIPKLILSKKMFNGEGSGVLLAKKVNYECDSVVLEKKWLQKGVHCYLVRIYNKQDNGEWDSYSYAFDDKMRFIWWEGCSKK